MAEQKLTTKKIIQLYEKNGLSLREIAREAGFSHEKVRKILIEAGVKPRGRQSTKRDIPREELVRLYVDEGLTKTEIAERLLISKQTLKKIMDRHGVEPQPYRRRRDPNRSYPRLPKLEIGESVELPLPPRPAGSGSHRVRYYLDAKAAGVRVSLETINGGGTIRVTRVGSAERASRNLRIPKEEVLDLHRSGKFTNKEIAERAGCTPDYVAALARAAGETRNKKGRQRWPVIGKEQLEELYTRQGLSPTAIGRSLGIHHGAVQRSLRIHKIPLRGGHTKSR